MYLFLRIAIPRTCTYTHTCLYLSTRDCKRSVLSAGFFVCQITRKWQRCLLSPQHQMSHAIVAGLCAKSVPPHTDYSDWHPKLQNLWWLANPRCKPCHKASCSSKYCRSLQSCHKASCSSKYFRFGVPTTGSVPCNHAIRLRARPSTAGHQGHKSLRRFPHIPR